MSKLQVVVSNQYNPFLNRAVEQYLTDHQEEDTVTLYLWKNQQTVVIGYNQNPFSECNALTQTIDEKLADKQFKELSILGSIYQELGGQLYE